MRLPPSLIYLKIRHDQPDGFGFWLPLFLLWPLIAILLALAFLGTTIADAISFGAGARYHGYTRLLVGALRATLDIRGTRVRVEKPDAHVNITII